MVGVVPEDMEVIWGLEHLSYEDQFFSLEERRLKEALRATFQYSKGPQGNLERDLLQRCGVTGWEIWLQLEEARFRLDFRKKFFPVLVVMHWNRLHREAVQAPNHIDWGLDQCGLLGVPASSERFSSPLSTFAPVSQALHSQREDFLWICWHWAVPVCSVLLDGLYGRLESSVIRNGKCYLLWAQEVEE